MSVKKISDKKRKTYLRMFRSILAALFAVIVILIVLQFFGINVSSMLAGVGIASIIVGFALQDALKDIIRGLEIVTDNYYEIGDIIKFGDNTGEVLSIGLRTTRIRDINSMNTVSIANRNIDEVEVVSEYLYVAIPFPYEIKPTAAEKLSSEIAFAVNKLNDVTSAELQGISEIAASTLNYQLQITCDPATKLATRRATLGIIADTFAAHRLRLPYQRLDVRERKS